MSSKEIDLLIMKSRLKIIDRYEDMLNYQNDSVSYLSNVEQIYYMNLLDGIYDKFFGEN